MTASPRADLDAVVVARPLLALLRRPLLVHLSTPPSSVGFYDIKSVLMRPVLGTSALRTPVDAAASVDRLLKLAVWWLLRTQMSTPTPEVARAALCAKHH
jgi:hypothetical protein